MLTPLPVLHDWRLSVDYEGIAWALMDREGESANSMGRRFTEELGEVVKFVEDAARQGEVKGLVIMSAKKSGFLVGADIREFERFDTEPRIKEVVHETIGLFDRIEKLPVPVVAAIHGYCLGGGLELALACHYRIADRDEATRLGFPEVKLGIFPGLNGTVRSIGLAGPMDAMTAMLTGRMLHPAAARAMGLIDQIVPSKHTLRWAARKAVLQKRHSKGAPWWKQLMLKQPVRGYLAKQMRAKTAAKVREDHYPAPYRLIDLFEQFGDDPARMKSAETEMFAPLMASEASRNLRRVFMLSEMLKDEAPKDGFKPKRVHVVGAGTMGGDIAAWCVVCGMQASLQDLDAAQTKKALGRAKGLFAKQLRSKQAVDAAVGRLIADPEGNHVKHADVVIEAIVEKLEVKQTLFQQLEAKMKPGAVLATNTSSLRLEDIARPLKDPGRLVGLHFFNPVAATAPGRGGAWRGHAGRGGAQGLHLRHRHQEAAAGGEELPRLPRQPRLDAVHDGGGEAPSRGHAARQDRSGRAQFRHAHGATRAHGHGRPRHRQQGRRGARLGEARGQSAVTPGQGGQARQEDGRRLLCLGRGEAEARRGDLRRRRSRSARGAS